MTQLPMRKQLKPPMSTDDIPQPVRKRVLLVTQDWRRNAIVDVVWLRTRNEMVLGHDRRM